MPSYMITLEGSVLATIRNYVAFNASSAVTAALKVETGRTLLDKDWSKIISIKVEKTRD